METAHREYDSWWYVLIMAMTSVYVFVCWFLCWILFLPCQLSSGTWKKPAWGWTDDLARSITKKISCRTQKCNFWKRPSTDFDKNYIFGIGTSSAIEWYLSFLLSISWPSDEPWVGWSADRPVRDITLAGNASTAKLKGKQLCATASCVIKMAGRTISKMKLPREK